MSLHNQEVRCILWSRDVRRHFLKNPPLVFIVRHMNGV